MVSHLSSRPDLTHYPDSDGQPMADNTLQYRWIVTLKENIEDLLAEDPNVFVAGDLLWYPVQGKIEIRQAPDVLVSFGRPKGERGSYIQHREDNIPPQIAFEILSPGNTQKEMARKLAFYDRYGVQEYYTYDPDRNRLRVWTRSPETGELAGGDGVQQWTSPRLGIRFEVVEPEMRVYRPDGTPFESFREVRQKVTEADRRAEEERHRAEEERRRAEEERRRAEESNQRAERLAQRLRELGVDPETL